MKKFVAVLFFALISCGYAIAGTLNEREGVELKAEITEMYGAFARGDAKLLLAKTHESVYKLAGGKDAFEKMTQQAVEQLLNSGVKFISTELGAPTQTYLAGDEEVCFVPRISIMETQGKRTKSTGFMIAIRKRGESEWKYLDGSGLRRGSNLLYMLLPELERGIVLPPNTVEAL